MIKIQNMTKNYDDQLILKDINLDIIPGKFTTLLGPNGSGKSTFLKILSGFELPNKGHVKYLDEDLSGVGFSHYHDICFVHENLEYNVAMSIGKFIQVLSTKIPKWDESVFQEMVLDRKLSLDKNFQEYSRGQKMQIALMMAIASNASVLLLDEITSVIDVYSRKYFLDLLDKYVKKGNTVVMTTNIINELEFYTDNLIILKGSSIVLNEPIENIPTKFIKIRNPGNNDHKIFDEPGCIWAGVNSDRSVSFIVSKELYKQHKIPDEFIDRRQSTLEDIFIYYFNQEGEINENVA